jgi:hydrogenase-1 operon protein HyaF
MMMTRCDSAEHKGLGFHSNESQKYTSPLVQIEMSAPGSHTQLPGNVLPILYEISTMLAALHSSGESNSIDLKRSPLSPFDCEALRRYLGKGEVSAEVNSHGPTRIQETSVSGVWWITHCNQDAELLGQFIEVTACPEMLVTPAEDLLASLSRLRERLASESFVVNPNDVIKSLEALVSDGEILDNPPDMNALRLTLFNDRRNKHA